MSSFPCCPVILQRPRKYNQERRKTIGNTMSSCQFIKSCEFCMLSENSFHGIFLNQKFIDRPFPILTHYSPVLLIYNLKVFWCFQGVQMSNTRLWWVKLGYCVDSGISLSLNVQNTWHKVFKNGQSKICGRQPLKNLKWYGSA